MNYLFMNGTGVYCLAVMDNESCGPQLGSITFWNILVQVEKYS